MSKAINAAPKKKCMLRDIYKWMQSHVPEFHEEYNGGPTSESWKNSVRHNLSLHKRFRRVENAAKAPWFWTIVDDEVQSEEQVYKTE